LKSSAGKKPAGRRRRVDRLGALAVRGGGVGIVLTILFMTAYLILQAAPLVQQPRVDRNSILDIRVPPSLLGGVEPFLDAAWSLRGDGTLEFRQLADGRLLSTQPAFPLDAGETLVRAKASVDQGTLVAATSLGRLALVEIHPQVEYGAAEEGSSRPARIHRMEVGDPIWLQKAAGSGPPADFDAQRDGNRLFAAWISHGGTLTLLSGQEKHSLLGGSKLSVTTRDLACEEPLDHLALLEGGRLVAAGVSGALHFWGREGQPLGPVHGAEGAPCVDLRSLIGGGTAVVLRKDGRVDLLVMGRGRDDAERLQLTASLAAGLQEPRAIVPAPRERTFLLVGDGAIQAGEATSRRLFPPVALADLPGRAVFSPRQDAVAVFGKDGSLNLHRGRVGFPGVSPGTLFSKVLYEGAKGPEFTYQSTGGSDAFQPKVSLIPLIFGTLKGAFWAMLVAAPPALLAALYSARFLAGRTREFLKPMIELLAGLPSVILGFVGALYLAPVLEANLFGILLLVPAALLATLLLGWLRARIPSRFQAVLTPGRSLLLLLGLYSLLAWGMLNAGHSLEPVLLGGPLREWVLSSFGIPFEQRNSIVVGLAMGFAVAPLIFTLAEEAFRNVPEPLADASLALGATPWQTSLRVIVPVAVPGVLSALVLGLGRAVGETMIVLMAAGGTPIIEWNPFQGFRSLAANLATELPEAPMGGMLYRVLFLSALALFAMTFVVNTLAEMLRQRSRRMR